MRAGQEELVDGIRRRYEESLNHAQDALEMQVLFNFCLFSKSMFKSMFMLMGQIQQTMAAREEIERLQYLLEQHGRVNADTKTTLRECGDDGRPAINLRVKAANDDRYYGGDSSTVASMVQIVKNQHDQEVFENPRRL